MTMFTTIWKKTTAAVHVVVSWAITGLFGLWAAAFPVASALHPRWHKAGRHAAPRDDGQDWADVLRAIPSPLRRRKVPATAGARVSAAVLGEILAAKRPEIYSALSREDRRCRQELCKYWPGEGCMRGVMPCDDDAAPSHADLDQWLTDDAKRYPAGFDGDFPVLDGDLLPPLDGIRIDAPMMAYGDGWPRPEPPLRPLPPARACPDVDAGHILDGLDRHFSLGLSLSPPQLLRHKAAGACPECADELPLTNCECLEETDHGLFDCACTCHTRDVPGPATMTGLEPWRSPRQHYATGLCWCGNCHDQDVSSVAEATARLREAVVHYSTDANRPCTAADVRIACGAAHWAIVSDDPDRVTCTDCHVALITEDVPGPAETASPPPPSGNGAEAATPEAVTSAGPGTTTLANRIANLDDPGWLKPLLDLAHAPLDQVTAAAR